MESEWLKLQIIGDVIELGGIPVARIEVAEGSLRQALCDGLEGFGREDLTDEVSEARGGWDAENSRAERAESDLESAEEKIQLAIEHLKDAGLTVERRIAEALEALQ